jgi:sulfate transporter 4
MVTLLVMGTLNFCNKKTVNVCKSSISNPRSLLLLQIAIANPNRQVHLLLSRSGIIDLIGDGWCFVRVHDAMQVCLQHVHNSSSSALKLALQTSGDSADSISTSKAEQKGLKQDGFFKNLWEAQDRNADSGGEVQPLLRQNLV